MGRADVLPFWFGESDEVTPEAVRAAGIASLQAGETFYSHNLGLPELRAAVAAYASRLHGEVAPERLAITSGGVNALIVAMQALIDAGDEVVAVTPVWPNLTAQPRILGARLRCVALRPDADGAWRLDLPALLAAITPRTRLLVSTRPTTRRAGRSRPPSSRPSWRTAAAHGTWILSDEVYERLYYRGDTANGAAPQLSRHRRPGRPAGGGAELFQVLPDDRLAPGLAGDAAGHDAAGRQAAGIQHLLRAGVRAARRLVALEQTEAITPRIVAHLKDCRDTLVPLLQAVPGVQASHAPGGMYAFCASPGRPIRCNWPSAWSPRPDWAWRPAWPSRPRPKAGCVGALRPKTRRAWCKACSG
jgi:aspartate/methionine/tyrosine aminotransferase